MPTREKRNGPGGDGAARKSDQHGALIYAKHNPFDRRAQLIRDRFGLSPAIAAVVAELAFATPTNSAGRAA